MGLLKKEKLHTYRLETHGMGCSKCESKVNAALSGAFNLKKINVSHENNEAILVAKEPLDLEKIKEVVATTGYELKGIQEE